MGAALSLCSCCPRLWGEKLGGVSVNLARDCALPSPDYFFKILFVGGLVGKSALRNRIVEKRFTPDCKPTIGLDFNVRDVQVGSKRIRLQLCDYGSCDENILASTVASFLVLADGIFLVYDVTSRQSLMHLQEQLLRYNVSKANCSGMVLLGNKADCAKWEREVDEAEGEAYAAVLGIPFIEVSAASGLNVEEAVYLLCSSLLAKSVNKTTAPLPIISRIAAPHLVIDTNIRTKEERDNSFTEPSETDALLTSPMEKETHDLTDHDGASDVGNETDDEELYQTPQGGSLPEMSSFISRMDWSGHEIPDYNEPSVAPSVGSSNTSKRSLEEWSSSPLAHKNDVHSVRESSFAQDVRKAILDVKRSTTRKSSIPSMEGYVSPPMR